jgi:hypothetical protein
MGKGGGSEVRENMRRRRGGQEPTIVSYIAGRACRASCRAGSRQSMQSIMHSRQSNMHSRHGIMHSRQSIMQSRQHA